MTIRRQFLQQSAVVSLSPWLPAFLARDIRAKEIQREGRILVVIQLDGGNDGLNSVIPYKDELYARARKELFIPTKNVLKLDDQIGLHSSMKPAAELLQDGRLTIVQGVGYPNPNRSHFESMSVWHHATLDTAKHDGFGWLGRAADHALTNSSELEAVSIGTEAIPVALLGRCANAFALSRDEDLKLLMPVEANKTEPDSPHDIQAFIGRTIHQSYEAARRLEGSEPSRNSATYPAGELSQKLQLASRLIKMESNASIYYVSQSGYDTHAAQLLTHSQLLREFTGTLKAFLDDMRESQLEDRIVVFAFSEFGRRVQENGSAGTDHGAAGPVFVAGKHVSGGIVGPHPSLFDLDNGDLKMSIDFRAVYSTLLDSWLGINPKFLLDQVFAPIPFISVVRKFLNTAAGQRHL